MSSRGTNATRGAPTLIDGRYDIGELLGRGRLTEVYAGTDHRLRRPVAIKRLLPELVPRPDVRARFRAEAELAAVIVHPNAVGIYDTGEYEGVPFLVVERLSGQSLATRMTKPLDPDWVRRLARQALGALEAAHAAGLVHGDVTPSNIMLGTDGQAKVSDFGIGRSLAGVERGPIAPADPRTDVKAMAEIVYQAVSGVVPAALYRSLGEVRPDVDPVLVAAVDRALTGSDSEQFKSAGQMAVAMGTSDHSGAHMLLGDPAVFLPGSRLFDEREAGGIGPLRVGSRAEPAGQQPAFGAVARNVEGQSPPARAPSSAAATPPRSMPRIAPAGPTSADTRWRPESSDFASEPVSDPVSDLGPDVPTPELPAAEAAPPAAAARPAWPNTVVGTEWAELAPETSAPRTPPRPRSRPARPRRGAVSALVVAALVAAGLGAWAVATARSPESATGKSGARLEDAPEAVLARRMTAVADGLTPADGTRAAELAKRLRDLAGKLSNSDAPVQASELAGKVATWTRNGELLAGAGTPAYEVLASVPGFVAPGPPESQAEADAVSKTKTKDKPPTTAVP